MYELVFTHQANADLEEIENDPSKRNIFKSIRKCFGYLEKNLRHPSLNTHEPQQRAYSLQVLPDGSDSRTAGLASESIFGKIPYGGYSPLLAAGNIQFRSLKGPNGEKVFEAYAQHRTPGAYRVFWYYGPKKGMITIVAITPRP